MRDSAILIRADAGVEMGTGHVMRMLALAQGWIARGHEVTFLSSELPPSLSSRLSADGARIVPLQSKPGSADDVAETLDRVREPGIAWLVLDGYHFGEGFQSQAKRAGLRVLFVDDFAHADRYSADLVLNQNLSARDTMYARRELHTRLLLGARYVLLRKEFLEWRTRRRERRTPAVRMLVTLGGGDVANVTGSLLELLAEKLHGAMELQVVVGPANPHHDQLQAIARRMPPHMKISLLGAAPDMVSKMDWADAAIAAAGSTCWELAFMGLPALLLIVADNQAPNAKELERLAMARVLDVRTGLDGEALFRKLDGLLHDASLRKGLAAAGFLQVDGQGVDRVIDAMELVGKERA